MRKGWGIPRPGPPARRGWTAAGDPGGGTSQRKEGRLLSQYLLRPRSVNPIGLANTSDPMQPQCP